MVAALAGRRAKQAATLGEQENQRPGNLGRPRQCLRRLALSLEFWIYFAAARVLGVDRHLAQHLALSSLGPSTLPFSI